VKLASIFICFCEYVTLLLTADYAKTFSTDNVYFFFFILKMFCDSERNASESNRSSQF
jgi:hypothetical protein